MASALPLWQLEERDPLLLEAILDVLDEQARKETKGGGVLARLKAKLGVVD